MNQPNKKKLTRSDIARIKDDWDLENLLHKGANVMEHAQRKIIVALDAELKQYLIENLSKIGVIFINDEEYISFCKERISIISHEANLQYKEFFLDYIDKDNVGKFIGSYSDSIEIMQEGTISKAIFRRKYQQLI